MDAIHEHCSVVKGSSDCGLSASLTMGAIQLRESPTMKKTEHTADTEGIKYKMVESTVQVVALK